MKKLVYAMLVALVGSPPAIAQSDGTDGMELTAEEQAAFDAEKSEEAADESEMLSEEDAAANDAAKADLDLTEEDSKPDEETE